MMNIISSWHFLIIAVMCDSQEDYPLLRHYEKEDSIEALRIKEWLKTKWQQMLKQKNYYALLKTWEPLYYILLKGQINMINC